MTFLKKLSFLLFISLLAFSACKKDEIIEEEEIITPTPEVIVDGSLTGIVVDQNGQAIQNTQIQVGMHSIFSDENGVFTFKNIKLNDKGALVTAEKEGYFYNAKFIRPNLNKMAFTRIMLIEKTLSGSFDASSGGSVMTNGDAKVDIPANSIKLESGGAYNGNVNVFATWLDPTGENLLLEMPGDLRGTNSNEEQVQLLTYGMIGVELEGDGGEALNIAEGKTATIEMPVPASLLSDAPATISLWHFDEATGYWVEDGTATLQDGKYVGTVSHFSFWNCDDPNFFIDLTGTVTDAAGNGIQNLQVQVENNSNGMVGYGYTNQDGVFNGFVPKDQELTIRAFDQCGDEIYNALIGPFAVDTEIPAFAVNSTANTVTIFGSLECNGTPISNGYIKIDYGSYYSILQLEPDGSFSGTINTCTITDIVATGYDLNGLAQSDPESHSLAGLTELNLGEISTCEDLTEILVLDINGTVHTFIDPEINDGGIPDNVIISAWDNAADSTFVNFNLIANTTGTYNPGTFDSVIFDGSNYVAANCWQACNDIDITFTTFETIPGGVVEGTFSGDASDWNGGTVPISGNFTVIRD